MLPPQRRGAPPDVLLRRAMLREEGSAADHSSKARWRALIRYAEQSISRCYIDVADVTLLRANIRKTELL